jgi:hypothetical protein
VDDEVEASPAGDVLSGAGSRREMVGEGIGVDTRVRVAGLRRAPEPLSYVPAGPAHPARKATARLKMRRVAPDGFFVMAER